MNTVTTEQTQFWTFVIVASFFTIITMIIAGMDIQDVTPASQGFQWRQPWTWKLLFYNGSLPSRGTITS